MKKLSLIVATLMSSVMLAACGNQSSHHKSAERHTSSSKVVKSKRNHQLTRKSKLNKLLIHHLLQSPVLAVVHLPLTATAALAAHNNTVIFS